MKARKWFYLHSIDRKLYQKMNAEDLMSHGISRSTAYRAIQKGVLPKHRLRDLQFKIFGDLPGWDGWRIKPGKLIDPHGRIYEPKDLENLAYLQQVLFDWNL